MPPWPSIDFDNLIQYTSTAGEILCTSNKQKHKIMNTLPVHRALMKEVGGTVELQRALDGETGWKGRARQIVMLKARVKHLEGQLRCHQRVSKRRGK